MKDAPNFYERKKHIDAPVSEQKCERINPIIPPNIGRERIARKAVPGIPKD